MKTVHNEGYKGFNIYVDARFEEGTTSFPLTDVHYDSVYLEVKVWEIGGGFERFFSKEEAIEKKRENRESLYNEVKKTISKLVEESKLKIDKHVREKEMTEGLPESLLEEGKSDQSEDELPRENDTVTNIFNVFIEAVKDIDTKEMDSFMQQISDRLKRNRGIR